MQRWTMEWEWEWERKMEECVRICNEGKCVRYDDFHWSSAYISFFVAFVRDSFRFVSLRFFLSLNYFWATWTHRWYLGVRWKWLMSVIRLFWRNRCRKKLLFSSFLFISRCIRGPYHGLSLCRRKEKTNIPVRRQWKSNFRVFRPTIHHQWLTFRFRMLQ